MDKYSKNVNMSLNLYIPVPLINASPEDMVTRKG
jgi:hypothetical protein